MWKKIISTCTILILILNINIVQVKAENNLQLQSKNVILMERSTGEILYSKNPDEKIFPASLTKILTAIIAEEYIGLDELIEVGYEINEIELDSSLAGHRVGEVITGKNLLRGLIIPSGNETANIVALNVAKKVLDKDFLEYNKAENIFLNLMNEKAKEIGLKNSNFSSVHGYHNDNHFSTARDLALLTRYAMNSDVITSIAKEVSFNGNGANNLAGPDDITVDYEWKSHNNLLKEGADYYKYATGLKTGFTSKAGNCLSATAKKDETELILITLGSETDAGRWEDAKKILEYGFNNTEMYLLQEANSPIDKVYIEGGQLGSNRELNVMTNKKKEIYIKKYKKDTIYYKTTYNPEFLFKNGINEDSIITLKAPIEENLEIGRISYYMQNDNEDDELIYQDVLIAPTEVLGRDLKSDIEFYFITMKNIFVTWETIPILLIIILLNMIYIRRKNIRKRRLKRRRLSKKYKINTKY